ncbi:S8 family serine peptidase [soil metagenome]
MRRFTSTVAAALAVGLAAALAPAAPAIALTPAGLAAGPLATPRAEPVAAASAAGPLTEYQVTLVTGDVVQLRTDADGKRLVAVLPDEDDPAPGYLVRQSSEGMYVFPTEAMRLLAAGRLDEELFNVTGLVEQGYDDASLDTLPLLLAGGEAVGRSGVGVPGAVAGRSFPSLGLAALGVDKDRARDFWAGLGDALSARRTSVAAGRSGGIRKVWLDAQVRATLDDSVPQIGAPAAWAAGYTGRKVNLAVLDTGVDATHPDLAGRVAMTANFSDDDDAVDGHGHGTHVAATAGGTGAASGGSRRGVAYQSRLFIGKVLDDNGSGRNSQVIAGMRWAVEQGADVINMSLGGRPTSGKDPLSRALNRLSARSGALFVVSAGNFGDTQSVSSPATADAALAVGAVTKSNALARFSSKGPRRGDLAVKPEITGPGVRIVAARAAGTSLGNVVDDDYTSLSGTSMAAPHVAGAAAILAQRHPRWTAKKLKAALVSTARPSKRPTVYEQGAGRVDVARAVQQRVLARPGVVSLPAARFPHDDGEVRSDEVTYRNKSKKTVTLDLALEATTRDGRSRPAEPLSVSPRTLTLAPGDRGSATVTADSALGKTGTYGALLTARQRGADAGQAVVLRTAVGFTKEQEMYTLTMKARDGSGRASGVAEVVSLTGQPDRWEFFFGRTRFRLPVRDYSAMGYVLSELGENGDLGAIALAGEPTLRLDRDKTVVLDEEESTPVIVHLPRPTVPEGHSIGYTREIPRFSYGSSFHVSGETAIRAVPTDVVTRGKFTFVSQHGRQSPSSSRRNYRYDVLLPEKDRIPADLDYDVGRDDLARIDNRYHAQGRKQYAHVGKFGFAPGDGSAFTVLSRLRLPLRRAEFVSANGTKWQTIVVVGPFRAFAEFSETPRAYAPGERVATSWLRQVIAPNLSAEPRWKRFGMPPYRRGNRIVALLWPFVDDAGHLGFPSPADRLAYGLYGGGRRIAGGEDLPYLAGVKVPKELSRFRLFLTTERDKPWWQLSTKVKTAWRFVSTPTGGERVTLPLLDPSLDLPVDLHNRAPADGKFVFGVTVRPPTGAAVSPLHRFRVKASFDGGRTWRFGRTTVLGGGDYTVAVRHPPKGQTDGFVALKLHAADDAGNRVWQSIQRAYRLTRSR